MKSTVSLVRSEEHYRGVRRSLQPFRKSLARAVADAPAVVTAGDKRLLERFCRRYIRSLSLVDLRAGRGG